MMDGIERETARMGRLVEDLLLLARLDEQHPFDLEPVELAGLAAESVETARTVGPRWPISFTAAEPVEVMGDWGALRQVVDNLLANVRAHTPVGTAASVTVGRTGPDAFVEVADEGPGITEQQAAMVFERFFRADPSRSRETGGAGLGLAIVATIVRAHGGDVSAVARTGQGALFRGGCRRSSLPHDRRLTRAGKTGASSPDRGAGDFRRANVNRHGAVSSRSASFPIRAPRSLPAKGRRTLSYPAQFPMELLQFEEAPWPPRKPSRAWQGSTGRKRAGDLQT